MHKFFLPIFFPPLNGIRQTSRPGISPHADCELFGGWNFQSFLTTTAFSYKSTSQPRLPTPYDLFTWTFFSVRGKSRDMNTDCGRGPISFFCYAICCSRLSCRIQKRSREMVAPENKSIFAIFFIIYYR